MIMCVLLCYPVSIRIYYQQCVLFLVSPMFTKFGMEDYWISSLLGIASGDNTFIANGVIATVLYSYYAILS